MQEWRTSAEEETLVRIWSRDKLGAMSERQGPLEKLYILTCEL